MCSDPDALTPAGTTPQASPQPASTPPEADPKRPVLMVMIFASPSVFDDIVTALLEFGVHATIVQSKGLMALLREEMPIFSGLASLLPEQTGSRMLISVTTTGAAAKVFEFLERELTQADRPIAFTVSLESIVGLRG